MFLFGGAQHALDITRNQVNFQINLALDSQMLECGDLDGVRNQVDRKAATRIGIFDPVHRQ